jgi:serine/threonine-protein kinase HipA
MSTQRARTAVEATMERIHESVDQIPLPPGAEHVQSSLESLWVRRTWPVSKRR